MTKVLDMRTIRYSNLFHRVTKIRSNHCFEYNNAIVFSVPRNLVSKAIGRDNKNLEILNKIIGKKIKIDAIPSAGAQSKASLIGKNRSRLMEMENILGQYFGIKKVLVK